MSPGERIAKLEALLERIKKRSAEPRPARGGAARTAEVAPRTPTEMVTAPPPPPLPSITPIAFEPALPPAMVTTMAPPLGAAGTGVPSPLPAAAERDATIPERPVPAPVPLAAEPSRVRAIETTFGAPPPMELMELDEEPAPSTPRPTTVVEPEGARRVSEPSVYESRSRLVTAPPVSPPDDDEDTLRRTPPPPAPVSEPTLTRAEPRELSTHALEELDEEPAPSSSRRPISVEEKLKQLAEDDGVHVPPPESGRQPAMPLPLAFTPEETGVRRSDDLVQPARIASDPSRPTPVSGNALDLVESGPTGSPSVAAFVGRVPEPKAATFGDLLDDALKL